MEWTLFLVLSYLRRVQLILGEKSCFITPKKVEIRLFLDISETDLQVKIHMKSTQAKERKSNLQLVQF